jgi:hypothetical protein
MRFTRNKAKRSRIFNLTAEWFKYISRLSHYIYVLPDANACQHPIVGGEEIRSQFEANHMPCADRRSIE